MKIIFVATEPHNILRGGINILISFWDMINTITFRKETFKLIKEGFNEGQDKRTIG